jgi:hypothetical protein
VGSWLSSIWQVWIVDVGKDATDAMIVLHPSWVMDRIDTYYIADLEPTEITTSIISTDFKQLEKTVRQHGLFTPNKYFWIRENMKFLGLWLGMVYFAVYGPRHELCYLVSALFAANLWHQAAFVAHDGIVVSCSGTFWNYS